MRYAWYIAAAAGTAAAAGGIRGESTRTKGAALRREDRGAEISLAWM